MASKDPNSALTGILRRLYNRTRLNFGQEQVQKLPGGLIIALSILKTKTGGCTLRMKLARNDGSPPSETEWKTVLEYWDGPLPPEGTEKKPDYQILTGAWDVTQDLEACNGRT